MQDQNKLGACGDCVAVSTEFKLVISQTKQDLFLLFLVNAPVTNLFTVTNAIKRFI